jgi:hypothetical protein
MALGKIGEPEARTVFYFAVGSAVAGAGSAWRSPAWSEWDWAHAAWLLPVGLLASLGQLVHDARLQPRRHAGGGQPAVLGHRVRAFYSVLLFDDRHRRVGWAGMA